MAFSAIPLSASTDGRPILISTIADPGNTIHTSQASATFFDEVQAVASNNDTIAHKITLEWGSNTASDLVIVTVPAGQSIPLPSVFLRNALVLKIFADLANKVLIAGRVIRSA